jgi:hypothetical protein
LFKRELIQGTWKYGSLEKSVKKIDYETVLVDSERVYFGSSPGPSPNCPHCEGVLIDRSSNIFDGEFFGGKFVEGKCMRESHIEDEWHMIEFNQCVAKFIRKMKKDKELDRKGAKEFNFEYSQD